MADSAEIPYGRKATEDIPAIKEVFPKSARRSSSLLPAPYVLVSQFCTKWRILKTIKHDRTGTNSRADRSASVKSEENAMKMGKMIPAALLAVALAGTPARAQDMKRRA